MYLEDLIRAYIESSHGSAVSGQFVKTWEADDFENQNENALRLILKELNKIIKSELISPANVEDLKEYRSDLASYLSRENVNA